MKEITRIITVQITDIAKVDDDFNDGESRDWVRENAGEAYKQILDVDDVVVTDVQDFIKDIEE